MNYLLPESRRPSSGPALTGDDNALVDVDGMYKSTIVSSDGKDVFEGKVPQDFNIDLANNWDPIDGLAEALPAAAGISQAVDSVTRRVLGGKQKFKYLSPQTWSGPSYLSLSIPFDLVNWKSSKEDVLTPLAAMLRLVTPETDKLGRMLIPGPSPVAEAISQYRKNTKEGQAGDASSLVTGKIFTCTIGNFFQMTPCVIKNVSAAFDGMFEHGSGLPMSVEMNVQIESYYPVSREDIETWFSTDRWGV